MCVPRSKLKGGHSSGHIVSDTGMASPVQELNGTSPTKLR